MPMRKLAAVLIACLCLPALAWSAERGLDLAIRGGEQADAPVVEHRRLYESSRALIIGNDAYNNGWPQLANAVNDANAIAGALEARGFETTVLTDLTGNELEDGLEEFFILAGEDPEARLFVWFAGHGHTEDGEGYLVGTDTPLPNVGARFRLSALSLRRFGEYVRLAQSKHVFVVFDSCFAGTIFDAERALPSAAITRATILPVRQFLTAGDAGQSVSDDGTFREIFLRGLDGPESADSNHDGYVTAGELGLYLTHRITNLTDARQTPRFGALNDKDFDRGDFVFLAGVDSGTTVAAAEPAGDRASLEIQYWRLIENSELASDYEAYLEKFPEGTFSGLARGRLVEIQGGGDADVLAAIEENTRETAEGVAEIAEGQRETVAALADLGAGLRSLANIGGLVAEPSAPAEYYHNARILSQRGEVDLALEQYRGLFSFPIVYADPVEEVATLATSVYGPHGAARALEDILGEGISDDVRLYASQLTDRQALVEVTNLVNEDAITYPPAIHAWGRKVMTQFMTASVRERRALLKAYDVVSAQAEDGSFYDFYIDKIAAGAVLDEIERSWGAMVQGQAVDPTMLEHPISYWIVPGDEEGGIDLSFQIMESLAQPYAFSICLDGPDKVVREPYRDCFDPFALGSVNDNPVMKLVEVPLVFSSIEYGDWAWPDGTVSIAIDYTDSTGQPVRYPPQNFSFLPQTTGRGGLLTSE